MPAIEPSLKLSPSPNAPIESKPLPTPKTFYPVPTTDPALTANWKTFTSEKYSFTFRFPPHLYANGIPCPAIISVQDHQCPPVNLTFLTKEIPQGISYEVFKSSYKKVNEGFLRLFVYDSEQGRVLPDEPESPAHGGYYKDEGIVIGGKTGRIFNDFNLPVAVSIRRRSTSCLTRVTPASRDNSMWRSPSWGAAWCYRWSMRPDRQRRHSPQNPCGRSAARRPAIAAAAR
jgi:hypothetical protein